MKRLNYHSILSIGNTTKSLSYETVMRQYAAKKCGKKFTMEVFNFNACHPEVFNTYMNI